MIYIKKINCFKDFRGSLSVIEHEKFKLFKVKRTFFINFKKKKVIRGQHAHKKCSQFIMCLSGKITLKLIDKNLKIKKFTLSEMNRGIYLKPMVWVEIISELTNSSIVCLTDRVYEKSDYIASKHEFIKLAKK